jgi:hypothetical protein
METRIVMQQELTAAHSDDEPVKLGLVVLNMVINARSIYCKHI